MSTTHMGHPRSPNSRGVKPAHVNAGTDHSSQPLWELLANPTKQAKLRWFCLQDCVREAIACAFLDELIVVCRESDGETSLGLTVEVVELARNFPGSELATLADGLLPMMKQLAFRCDMVIIVREMVMGTWTPKPIPISATPAAALRASA